jgi:hypothetical protein
MKQLLFIFAVALTSCGTTSDFASNYNSAGSPFGSMASFTQPNPLVLTRAKAKDTNTGTIILNPGGTSGGSSCPGSMGSGTIVTRPTTTVNQNSFMNGKALINQIGNQVRRTSSPTQRQIVRRF